MAAASSDNDRLLHRLQEHMASIVADQTIIIARRMFEEAELVLPKSLPYEQQLAVIHTLASFLTSPLQQDATPAVNLLLRLLDNVSYAQLLTFGDAVPIPYVQGLAAGEHMVPFNRLILSILEKATLNAADAAQVAGMLETMLALVTLWLTTPDAGIASQASQLLIDLLRVDQSIGSESTPAGGQGLVWKRIFGDRNVYARLYETCTTSGSSSLDLSKNQRTLAQARLMEWLPIVGAMNWDAISNNHHPDLEQAHGIKESGLLEFTTIHMVDRRDDVLMHRCLIDFYSALLSQKASSQVEGATDSPALLYLIANGIHVQTIAIYLGSPGNSLDPVDAMFLYGPAANYLATWASSFPTHFATSQAPAQVNARLAERLTLSSGRWISIDASTTSRDLHLLASLPRATLLPGGDGSGNFSLSPISLLPSRSTHPDVLNTLATIFCGPARPELTFPNVTPDGAAADSPEAACARALYYHYVASNPRFWPDIIAHATTVALKDLSLAAHNLLLSIINANWATEPILVLPSHAIATPDSGALAVLAPPALEYVLPYLLGPAQTFSNLVGGRGDVESAAYKVATAKFDTLSALHSRVSELVVRRPGEGFEDIAKALSKKIEQGPWGGSGNEVGGRIATLDA